MNEREEVKFSNVCRKMMSGIWFLADEHEEDDEFP